MFDLIDDKELGNISIVETYSEDYIYQITNILDKIITQFNDAIDTQLFYTDFWDNFTQLEISKIRKYIYIKNEDWIDYYLYRR